MTAKQTKTFIVFEVYEPYESYDVVLEVESRDLQHPGVIKAFTDTISKNAHVPADFRFFDADVEVQNGKEVISNKRNYSAEYIFADEVISLAEFKARELPKISAYKKDKGGLLTRIFNLNKPIMHWYIKGVEETLKAAEASQSTLIAATLKGACYLPVGTDMVIIDRNLRQIYPVVKPSASVNDPKI